MADARTTKRQRMLLLGGVVVACAAGIGILAGPGGRGPASSAGQEGDLREEDVREDEVPRPTADLAEVSKETTTRRDVGTSAQDAPGTAADVDAPDTAVTGIFLAPRGLAGFDEERIFAWPVLADGSGELDPERHGSAARMEGRASGGTWSFEGIEPGTWSFVGRCSAGGRIAYGASAETVVVEGAETGPISVLLTEYFVEGRVTDSAGAPIAGSAVTSMWVGTDWRAGQRWSELRVEGKVSTIDGSVVPGEDDDQLARELVHMAALGLDPGGASAGAPVLTDAAGRYHIPLEGPGAAVVVVPDPSRDLDEGDARWITRKSEVEVTSEAPAARADFELVLSASLAGRLTLEGLGPAAALEVVLSRHGSTDTLATTTDAEGRFRFMDLEPGQHLFFARVEEENGPGQSIWGDLMLRAGDDVQLDETLEPSGGIRGVVLDGTGAPVADVVVTAVAEDHPGISFTARTGFAGRFELTGVYLCTYVLDVDQRDERATHRVHVPSRVGVVDAGTITVD